MVMIVGWGDAGGKDLGEVAPLVCPNCHNEVVLHHIRSRREFSVYFIPIAQYGGQESLVCPVCRAGLVLQPQQVEAAARMRAATAVYRRGGMSAAAYEPLVAAFWARLGVSPSSPAAPAAPPAEAVPASEPPATATLAARLQDLARLHADGVLTDEEFAAAKRRLIGG